MIRTSKLVKAAIATVAEDPFYREWFAYKDDLYNPIKPITLVDYSQLKDFSPTCMTGAKLSNLPVRFENKFYIVTKLSWYDWKQRLYGDLYEDTLAITEVSKALFNRIKMHDKAWALKLTTSKPNSPFSDIFRRRGESL